MTLPFVIRSGPEGTLIRVRVQPRSSRNAVVGLHGDALKVAVTAPPVEGAANAALQKVLAAWLGVSKSRVVIERGETGRNKQVLLEGVPASQIPDRNWQKKTPLEKTGGAG